MGFRLCLWIHWLTRCSGAGSRRKCCIWLNQVCSQGKKLAAREIPPVVGDAESKNWLSLISSLDVVIDAMGGDIKNISESTLTPCEQDVLPPFCREADLYLRLWNLGTRIPSIRSCDCYDVLHSPCRNCGLASAARGARHP